MWLASYALKRSGLIRLLSFATRIAAMASCADQVRTCFSCISKWLNYSTVWALLIFVYKNYIIVLFRRPRALSTARSEGIMLTCSNPLMTLLHWQQNCTPLVYCHERRGRESTVEHWLSQIKCVSS